MHARPLFRILEAAIAASTLSGCCLFGRSYGPTERSYLVIPAEAVRATTREDSSLPSEVCRDLCGSLSSEETLLGCFAVTMELAPIERPRRLTWEYRNDGDRRWRSNGTQIPADRAREIDLEPRSETGQVDPSICLAFHSREKDVSVRNCSLASHAPGPARGTPAVQCRKRREGGCDVSFGSGRDTRARVTPLPFEEPTETSAWLANAAAAEWTSVRAFAEMAAELAGFGAPARLVRAARRARRDEVVHATMMARLARTRGGRPARVGFSRMRPRSLEAFALENALEGCVRELFGAAVALHQGQNAARHLRATFLRIARDETRHAALALRTFRWCAERLDASARTRVCEAMEDAMVAVLERWHERSPAAAVELGWPDETAARAIATHLRDHVWRALV